MDAESGSECVFCGIVAGQTPAEIIEEWPDAIAFVPLFPVAEGHLLVVPKKHVEDFTADPDVTADAMRRAAQLSAEWPSLNVITSKGRPATQSVWHAHFHLVPRVENDGLALPWYSGRTKKAKH